MNTATNQTIAKIELAVVGETLVPDVITALLGIVPTRAFTQGDAVPQSTRGIRYPWGLWALAFTGSDLQTLAVQLLDAVRGKEAAIQTINSTQGLEVLIGIWWEPVEGQGGFTVSSTTLAHLCALSSRIDVYFPGHQ